MRFPRRKPPHTTIAERLAAAGYTPDDLTDRTSPRTATVTTITQGDGSTVTGLMYQLDFDTKEQVGTSKLIKALAGDDPRNVQMTKAGRRHVAQFDENAILLSVTPVPNTYVWGHDDPASGGRKDRWGTPLPEGYRPEYARYYDSALPHTREDAFAEGVALGRIGVSELRSKARDLGLTHLPRTKDALAEAVLTSAAYRAQVRLSDVWPASFTYGVFLVLRADEGPSAVVIDALRDAIDAGALAITATSGFLASGVFLYDARDETPAAVAARKKDCDWYDASMAALAPVASQLREWGHQWAALGHPTLRTSPDGTQETRYLYNGLLRGDVTRDGVRCVGQPFGFYTLDELLAEKFVRDRLEEDAAYEKESAKYPLRRR